MPLTLLPNVFQDDQPLYGLLPDGLQEKMLMLDGLIAENERSGRRYLLKVLPNNERMRQLPILVLNEHTSDTEISEMHKKIESGEHWGLVSDAGLPCVADPGSQLVLRLHRSSSSSKAAVDAIPGPSSIFMALMLSGFSGQRFAFHGYLPKTDKERRDAFLDLEKRSYEKQETQIWIETPYRNQVLIKTCCSTLSPTTLFAAVSNITLPQQQIRVMSIEEWKRKEEAYIDHIEGPTVFLLFAVSAPSVPYKRLEHSPYTKSTSHTRYGKHKPRNV